MQNYANQDAFQVAVIAGNCDLADIIRNHTTDDVGEFFQCNIHVFKVPPFEGN